MPRINIVSFLYSNRHITTKLILSLSLLALITGVLINLRVAGIGAVSTNPVFSQILLGSGISARNSYGGVAWSDYDNDGYLDLFTQKDGLTNALYHNNHDGTFTEVTEDSGIAPKPVATAGFFGDYDNDGCPDLYLVFTGRSDTINTPGIPDLLYHNNCNGTFTDVTKLAGISDLGHGYGASWADYDRDGRLDLYVANWGITKGLTNFSLESNILYHNNGNGTFTVVTDQAQVNGKSTCHKVKDLPSDSITIKDSPHPVGTKESFQPIWFDYNNDGWPDLFVTTDHGVSPLYRNNRDGTFTDVTESAGLCLSGTGMGASVGDYDNDGFLDLYVTNVGQNYLWHNNSNGTFNEVGTAAGVSWRDHPSIGWGTGFFDYDNDGWLDLYAVEGIANRYPLIDQINQRRDRLYKNDGHGLFTETGEKVGIVGNDPKNAAAFGDFNNDGFIDIFVNSDTPPGQNRLYRNKPNGNHWLTVQLIGTKSNRDAVGARIKTKVKNHLQFREVQTGTSFLSQNSLWQTFGLGHSESVDELEISWPSGIKQVLTKLKVDRKIVVTESGN